MMSIVSVKSTCGAVKLLSAIFCLPKQEQVRLKDRLGLPVPKCVVCGAMDCKLDKNGLCLECFTKQRSVMVECSQCHKLFARYIYQVVDGTKRNYKHFFCDRRCLGRWTASHYGFLAHPENCYGGKRNKKHDYEAIWQAHLDTGYGAIRLGRLLNMSQTTVSGILHAKRLSELGKKAKIVNSK